MVFCGKCFIMIKNIFDQQVIDELISRINQLHKDSRPEWGKMDVAQMLAHNCVSYELIYENRHQKPKGLKKLLLKWFIKGPVVSEKPYKKNSPTAPEFLISSGKDFDTEKQRLIGYLNRTQQLGATHFDGRYYHSFGELSLKEWNNMLYKHLDHHLRQFGV